MDLTPFNHAAYTAPLVHCSPFPCIHQKLIQHCSLATTVNTYTLLRKALCKHTMMETTVRPACRQTHCEKGLNNMIYLGVFNFCPSILDHCNNAEPAVFCRKKPAIFHEQHIKHPYMNRILQTYITRIWKTPALYTHGKRCLYKYGKRKPEQQISTISNTRM